VTAGWVIAHDGFQLPDFVDIDTAWVLQLLNFRG